MDGLEIEANAVLAEGLLFDFGGSYSKARLTGDPQLPPQVNPAVARDGDPLPEVPLVQFNVGLTYTVPLSADSSLRFSGDVTHRGSSDTQFNNSTRFNIPLASYNLVNLRAGLEWKSWQFTVFVKNLQNRRAQVDAISSDQDPLALITSRPRTGGLAVNYKF